MQEGGASFVKRILFLFIGSILVGSGSAVLAHNPHGDCEHIRDVPSIHYEEYVYGGSGDDKCNGVKDADVIMEGLRGADDFDGLGRSDLLFGDKGDDILNAGPSPEGCGADPDCAKEYVEGNDGDDAIYGEKGEDRLHGGSGDDRIYDGAGGNDTDIVCDGDGVDSVDVEDGDNKDEVYYRDDGDNDPPPLTDEKDEVFHKACPFNVPPKPGASVSFRGWIRQLSVYSANAQSDGSGTGLLAHKGRRS
jgi:Ca2+-binding RTX toxin-like protein